MSMVQHTDADARYRLELRLGKVSVSTSGMGGSALLLAFLIVAIAAIIWAVGATYVMLADISVVMITDAALLKAAAILGAFTLFGYLVGLSEMVRWRERRLDAEFETGRQRASTEAP